MSFCIRTKQSDIGKYINLLLNPKGFTLAELITSIAIIGILATIGIQQYTQYKIRAYDAHSKQALHDMNLTCKAFWSLKDTPNKDECDLAKAKEHGFVQNSEVVANVLSTLPENFCASAKHNKSPNTYSSDYVGVVSDNADCGTGLAAELAAKKPEADRLAKIQQKYGNCGNDSKEFFAYSSSRHYRGQGETFIPISFFKDKESRFGNWAAASTLIGAEPALPILGYCVNLSSHKDGHGHRYTSVNIRAPGCKRKVYGRKKCESFGTHTHNGASYCKKYSSTQIVTEIPCRPLSSEAHRVKQQGYNSYASKSQIHAILTSYKNYNKILEDKGEKAADEYKTEEKNRACGEKIRKIVKPPRRIRSCQSAAQYRGLAYRQEQSIKNSTHVVRKDIDPLKTIYYYLGGYYKRATILAYTKSAEYQQTKCNDTRRSIAQSKIERELYGPECLRLQEAGELNRYHLESLSASRVEGIGRTVKTLGITAQSYCENNKFGCN